MRAYSLRNVSAGPLRVAADDVSVSATSSVISMAQRRYCLAAQAASSIEAKVATAGLPLLRGVGLLVLLDQVVDRTFLRQTILTARRTGSLWVARRGVARRARSLVALAACALLATDLGVLSLP